MTISINLFSLINTNYNIYDDFIIGRDVDYNNNNNKFCLNIIYMANIYNRNEN